MGPPVAKKPILILFSALLIITARCLSCANYTNPVSPSHSTLTLAYSSLLAGTILPFEVGVSSSSTPILTPSIPAKFSISPPLPPGLTLNPNTGAISGAPTSALSRTSYTVTATLTTCTDATTSCTVSKTFLLSIYDFGTSTTSNYSLNGTINNYAYVTDASISAGAVSFHVDTNTGFSVGTQILIIQIQSQTTPSTSVKTWELATISGIAGLVITVSTGISGSYVSGTLNVGHPTAAKITQIVSVPTYHDVTVLGTLNASSNWSPTTGKGGVLAFEANGTVSIGDGVNPGTIDVSGAGFTGGGGGNRAGGDDTGGNGESWNGYGTQGGLNYVINANLNNNGGGGGGYAIWGPSYVSGGGGALGGAGSVGTALASGTAGSAGAAMGGNGPGFITLLLGSGGGGGTSSSGGSTGLPGASGGGIILLLANNLNITSTGTIQSIGSTGSPSSGANAAGVSGSGSGGSIYLISHSTQMSGTVQVSGGPAYVTGVNCMPSAPDCFGGAGGYGLLRLDCDALDSTDCANQPASGGTPSAASYVTNLGS